MGPLLGPEAGPGAPPTGLSARRDEAGALRPGLGRQLPPLLLALGFCAVGYGAQAGLAAGWLARGGPIRGGGRVALPGLRM